MNKKNWIIFTLALVMIGGTAWSMNRLKTNQKLGRPGIKAKPIAGSQRMDVYLPQWVLDYDSMVRETAPQVLRGMPQDTSFMQRLYARSTNDALLLNVVMMGTDRTSIHKPQFCLTGSGWNIDGADSSLDTVRIQDPHPYDLSVMKLVSTREDNDHKKIRGIYVYWFVADNDLTAQHETRMWNTATHLLRTGELERWAYVACFAVCYPGDESATYARMKKFITAAVPQFQLATNPGVSGPGSAQTAAR